MDPLTPEDRRNWFSDLFFDEIESWFTADIACCDSCHDEFVVKWPHAYEADNAEFQRSGIPLDCLYDGSRLPELYSKAEFDEYIKGIECPRCGCPLTNNVWPYEFPFDINPDFEASIDEIADIANTTPFLLLKNGFASRVYDSVMRLGSGLKSTPINSPLYRARSSDVPQDIAEFDAPPPRVVGEGRYNHAGSPVLYLASDPETCIEEMRRHQCIIAEVEFAIQLKVLDLNTPESTHPEYADELAALTYSALMSAKQSDDGWHKPAYVFSRFIADCARASGIQAIKYPSTQIAKGGNFNLVIVDPSLRLADNARVIQFTRFAPDA